MPLEGLTLRFVKTNAGRNVLVHLGWTMDILAVDNFCHPEIGAERLQAALRPEAYFCLSFVIVSVKF